MTLIIAKKECLEMWRDGRFRGIAGVVLLLLLAALVTGWQHYRQVQSEHSAAQQASRQQWLNQGARNPHSAAHYGVYAFKPVMPLSFVDLGLDPYTGVSIWLEAHYQNPSRYRPAEDATAMQRFGELTAAGVLQLLLPLLIIVLAFPAFAGEREQGTLRQLLSLGVPRRKLIFGKALGVALALGALLVPATIIGVLTFSFTANADLLAANVARMAWMGLGYLAYFGVFLALTLALSARAPSPRAALVSLLGFWIIGSLLLPRLASDAAERFYRVPSAKAFWEAVNDDIKKGLDGHNPSDQRREALLQEILAQYQVTRVEDLPVNFSGIALQAGEEYGNTVFDKHVGALWEIYGAQERMHRFAAGLSPFLAVRHLSMGLAGTDLAQHRHFLNAAEQYRRELNKMLNDDLTHNSKIQGYTYFAERGLWDKTPDFIYTAPDAAWVMQRQAGSFGVLLAWLAGAIIFARRAVRRMNI